MAHVRADRIMEVATTTGTGTFTVVGAVLGYGTLATLVKSIYLRRFGWQ